MTSPHRRELAIQNLDEIVSEVTRLAAGDVTTTGAHSFPEIVRHLALSNDMTTGRMTPPKPPLFMRLLLPFIRSSILKGSVRPGMKLPANAEKVFWPEGDIGLKDAIAMLRDSLAHYQERGPMPVHPIFGKASREQMDRLTCNHAAMHLSFVHPA